MGNAKFVLWHKFQTQLWEQTILRTFDLGIWYFPVVFENTFSQREKLKNIKLELLSLLFFAGGLIGGLSYTTLNLKLNTLIIAGVILLLICIMTVLDIDC
jgi:hypothetical protein